MTRAMTIDFVSDVSCPWCVIGLLGLEEALSRTRDVIDADLRFQPFELSPEIPPEGRSLMEHLTHAYGAPAEQMAASRADIRDRAAALGFTMAMSEDARLYNTFDARRLLHWARIEGRQLALKHALFEAYHTRDESPADQDILVAAAEKAGLDGAAAREILETGRFEEDVRQAQYLWQTRGVTGVPAAIVNSRYLISGAQPADAYEQALRQIAAEPEPAQPT